MNINLESPSDLRRKLTIELGAEEIERELDQAYRELGRQVRLKGFRPGRAPRRLLERFFGDQVRGEVMQKLIRESTEKALADHALKPAVDPEIVTEEADFPKLLRFAAVFDLKPEIVVKDYQGWDLAPQPVEVREEEIAEVLEGLRRSHAPLKKVQERSEVEAGDLALVQVTAQADGRPLSEVSGEPQLVEIAEGALRHGLFELMKGARLGEPKHLTKSYPDDYGEPHLRGRTIEWTVVVKDILYRELPALDDDFARDLGTFESLAQLREQTRQTLLAQAKERALEQARQQALKLLLERNPVEAPASMVAREAARIEAEVVARLRAEGLGEEEALERVRGRREELNDLAAKRVRERLIVDALAAQENIEVSDDELAARVARMVSESGRERERVARFYAREENRLGLRAALRHEKALQWLVEHSQPRDAAQPTEA
jgi:trigger factor